MSALRNVYRAANKLGEAAIWHAASKRLLWIDLYDPKLFIHDPVKGETQVRDIALNSGAVCRRNRAAASRRNPHFASDEADDSTLTPSNEQH